MAKYTVTILTLQKNDFDFGLNSYPIFDEAYRNTLNNNILNYYLESEIGVETAELFKRLLNNRMALIMPKYNKMYLAQDKLLQDGILGNVALTETLQRETDSTSNQQDSGTGTQTGSSMANNKNLYQDTPQGSISMQDLDSQNVYATNVTLDRNTNSSTVTDTSTSTRDFTNNGTENYVKTIVGNNGRKYNVDIFNDLVNKLKNIDMLIINELSDLFMGIF